jgi:hypothetical protein
VRVASKAGAILLVAGLLGLMVLPAAAATPEYVEVDGQWELARADLGTCTVAVPPTMGGSVHLEADFAAGTIRGSIDGNGAGSHVVPAGCGMEVPVTWYAEISSIEGTIQGELDSTDGSFDVEFEFQAEAWGYKEAPGISWKCARDESGRQLPADEQEWTPTCALPEIWPDQAGRISGTINPQGPISGEIDLYTFDGVYCATEYEGQTAWGDGCPTLGVWTVDVTEAVIANERPVISALTVDPAEPVTTDVVRLSVTASDPEGENLTYQWTVDGETQQTVDSPTSTWTTPTRGSHTIEVRAIDPHGAYDEAAISIWVEDPGVTTTGGTDDQVTTTTATSTTTTKPSTAGTTTGETDEEGTRKGRQAGGSAVLATAIALAGDALRRGKIRGKAGELYRWGKKKVDRGRELAGKAERAQAVLVDPTILVKQEAERAKTRLEKNPKVQRARRKVEKAARYGTDPTGAALEDLRESKRGRRIERRLKKAEKIATNPLRAALDRVRESRRGRRLERRSRKFAAIAADPYGTVDRAARKKMKEYVSRIRMRAKKRLLESGASRRYRRLAERLDKKTKGILNAESTVRLIRAIGNPRRFSREVRNNPALVRHVIRRAGLSPLAVEALGGPKSIGRMLGRMANDLPREIRRVGRFLGRPKGWLPEIGRGLRRVGRVFRF